MNKINLNKTKLKVALVASMAGLFVPAQTYAVDLVASSEIPSIGFVDLDLAAGTNFDTWSLSGDSQFFLLQDVNANLTGENTHTVMSIFGANGADLNENSFIVDSAGDINLANGSVFVDRSSGAVGIGTSAPADDLSIVSSNPTIRLEDTDGTNWEINSTPEGTMFDITNDTAAVSMLKIESDAPENSLVLERLGVGLGTDSPQKGLHIVRNDGKGAIRVEETAITDMKRYLLQLKNNGATGAEFTDTSNGEVWQFAQTPAGGFTISRAASGGQDFVINNDGRVLMGPGPIINFDLSPSGNLIIPNGTVTATSHISSSSRTVKKDFAKVDAEKVMANIKAMELTEWSYKDANTKGRHIGPMAEEFYGMFGLGPDDKHVAATDMASIALIAAKELQKENSELKVETNDLKQRLASLENLVSRLASARDSMPSVGEKVAIRK